MSIESIIENAGQAATITAEAPYGAAVGQTAMGGADRSDDVWLTVADGVPCLVDPGHSAIDRQRNDAREDVISATIYFRADPVPGGLSTRHRITVTATRSPNPDPVVLGVYAVTGAIDPNYLGRLFVVACERVRIP